MISIESIVTQLSIVKMSLKKNANKIKSKPEFFIVNGTVFQTLITLNYLNNRKQVM